MGVAEEIKELTADLNGISSRLNEKLPEIAVVLGVNPDTLILKAAELYKLAVYVVENRTVGE